MRNKQSLNTDFVRNLPQIHIREGFDKTYLFDVETEAWMPMVDEKVLTEQLTDTDFGIVILFTQRKPPHELLMYCPIHKRLEKITEIHEDTVRSSFGCLLTGRTIITRLSSNDEKRYKSHSEGEKHYFPVRWHVSQDKEDELVVLRVDVAELRIQSHFTALRFRKIVISYDIMQHNIHTYIGFAAIDTSILLQSIPANIMEDVLRCLQCTLKKHRGKEVNFCTMGSVRDRFEALWRYPEDVMAYYLNPYIQRLTVEKSMEDKEKIRQQLRKDMPKLLKGYSDYRIINLKKAKADLDGNRELADLWQKRLDNISRKIYQKVYQKRTRGDYLYKVYNPADGDIYNRICDILQITPPRSIRAACYLYPCALIIYLLFGKLGVEKIGNIWPYLENPKRFGPFPLYDFQLVNIDMVQYTGKEVKLWELYVFYWQWLRRSLGDDVFLLRFKEFELKRCPIWLQDMLFCFKNYWSYLSDDLLTRLAEKGLTEDNHHEMILQVKQYLTTMEDDICPIDDEYHAMNWSYGNIEFQLVNRYSDIMNFGWAIYGSCNAYARMQRLCPTWNSRIERKEYKVEAIFSVKSAGELIAYIEMDGKRSIGRVIHFNQDGSQMENWFNPEMDYIFSLWCKVNDIYNDKFDDYGQELIV